MSLAMMLLPESVFGGVNTICTSIVVNTICKSTSSIISIIRYLGNSNHIVQDINVALKEIDLEFTIQIINQVILEHELVKDLTESIKNAIIGVSVILEEIRLELETIHDAIKYHESKYFANWRSLVWHNNVEKLKKYDLILQKRYALLFELLKIYKIK
jgi:hypothetical protein